ncbi:glycosyltransferase [Microbacterium sp. SSW1-59]|uniref:glycosyltransferase n=1 Tax=Microbacterium xanthum TaxID=3079794 RepID=UPI002AD3D1BF|nr:glycosyltransferase [Microbacterium sp. SSW1-59]MDZ8201562.1 glycosyltransferase [Microbacterium sp. SSW1-59]
MKAGPTVLVFPAWRSNPYLNILSLAPRSQGFQFAGETDFYGFLRAARRLRRGDVAHIHWTSPIAQSALSERDADSRVRQFERALSGMRRRGVRIVWTVHNRLPHELTYRRQEQAIYRALADAADAVHVMTADTPSVIADVCVVPSEKVRVIPHPSYQGIYDTGITRTEARESFGLAPDEVAVLFLGQIRPYKGVTTLMRAADRAARDDGRPLALLLAGHTPPGSLAELEPDMPSSVRAVTFFDFVPDGDIARWFAAADVAVFPYRRILNSGSVHLAATFGVPAVLPDEPHLRDQYAGQSWVSFFDTASPEESLTGMLSDSSLLEGVDPADVRAFLEAVSPWRVSRLYGGLLEELSGRAVAEAS